MVNRYRRGRVVTFDMVVRFDTPFFFASVTAAFGALPGVNLNLQDLNNRFATYIERVRYLEQQNKLLDAQLRQITVKYDSNLPEIYVNELRRLRQITETLNNDKSLLEAELERLRSDVLDLRQE